MPLPRARSVCCLAELRIADERHEAGWKALELAIEIDPMRENVWVPRTPSPAPELDFDAKFFLASILR
jgi:hypothetical protein